MVVKMFEILKKLLQILLVGQPELTNLPDSSRPLLSDEPLRESTLTFKIRLNKTQIAKLKKAEGRGKSRTEVMKVALLKHLRNF